MVEGVSYEQTYMVLGLTLVDCEPEVVAYSGPSWHSRACWRKVSMPYDNRMASYEGYVTYDGGAPAPYLAHKTKDAPQPVETETAANSKCARHSTNVFDPK